jgi:hypothetical protein
MSEEQKTPDFDIAKLLFKIEEEREKRQDVKLAGNRLVGPNAWKKPEGETHGHWFERLFGIVRWAGSGAITRGIIQDLHVRRPGYWDSWREACHQYERQRNCNHLKGGRLAKGVKDYNVSFHTFIDGSRRIRCLTCGKEAWDTPNTQFMWQYMVGLYYNSTNSASASESLLYGVYKGEVLIETFPQTKAGLAQLQQKYPNWNGKFSRQRFEGKLPPGEFQLENEDRNPDEFKLAEGESPIKVQVVLQDKWPAKGTTK